MVFFCPEGANVRFLIEDLEDSDRIIRYGTWAFTSETTTKNDNILFGGQKIISMDAIGDVIIVMVTLKISTLSLMFLVRTCLYPEFFMIMSQNTQQQMMMQGEEHQKIYKKGLKF